jgi:class 3 adenylate cyclase
VQQLASPGGVAITHDCHSLVSGLVHVEPMGRRKLKGIPDPVEVFKLSGLAVSCGPALVYARAANAASTSAALSADAWVRS